MSDAVSAPVSSSTSARNPALTPTKRLTSLDALRGFDMFWIVGGEGIVHALYKAWPNRFFGLLDYEMDHSAWAGVRFYDLIFPLFVFIAGTSLVFSLTRMIQQNGRAAALRRIFFRSLFLYIFGLLIYGGISKGLDQVRWLGVLQRIAISYCVAGVLFSFFRPRALAGICAGLLLGYWAVVSLVPIRDFNLQTEHLATLNLRPTDAQTRSQFLATTSMVRGKFDDGLNLPNQVDFLFLPGYKWDGAYDPEGLLSTFPAITTCLLGLFAGLLLKNQRVPDQKKVLYLLLAGVAGLVLGFSWGLVFPVIKKIWTSSYVLVAGGYSCLFLAAFYQIIEIWEYRKWCLPFIWIGMNAITMYMLYHFIDFGQCAALLAGGPIANSLGKAGGLLLACVEVLLMFALVRFLYRRKIFLRL